jgi:transposase
LKRSIEADYRSIISDACFLATTKTAHRLVLYDVTTLYFKAQKEDDFRKPGLSKERKLDPQIVVGLLVDRRGFPLEVRSFEGNTAEVKTIEPVLSSFIKRHGLAGITVAADAAMLSSANITALEQMGYTYIIASKMTRFPLEIENYLNISPDTVLKDGQIFESKMSVTVNGKRTHRRCVYQYRKKRADLDLRNIEKSVAKATKMIEGKADVKRNRFLQLTGGIRELNVSLIETHKKRAGIKGYLTNLKISAEEVITAYHQLFEVEKSFRMSKSDLRARPIFHHTRQSIEAHLTIVFAALAISR